jgi:hypothetical protein
MPKSPFSEPLINRFRFSAAPPAVRNGCAFPGGLATKALGYAPRFVVTNKVSRCAHFLTIST